MSTISNHSKLFNTLILLVAGVSITLALRAHSAEQQTARPTTVAVINWLDMTDHLDSWKNVQVTLKDSEDSFNQENESRVNNIKSKQDELKILPPDSDAAKDATQEIKGMIAQYQTWNKLQVERLTNKELHAQLSLYVKINDAVKVIAERDGWDIVLWNDSDSKKVDLDRLQESAQLISTRHVFYANKAVDISDTVTQYMNNMEANKGSDDTKQ